MKSLDQQSEWFSNLRPGGVRELFEHLPNTLYFAKDCDLKLMAGNRAFALRCGYQSESEMIGHSDAEIFSAELAEKYRSDDRQVIESGQPLLGIVELFPNRLGEPEWFVTDKVPLFGKNGNVHGLCGTVRSYEGARAALQPYLDLVPVTEYLKEHFDETISISEVAKRAGMSVRQLERRFRATFKTTPRHYIMKLRVLTACELLVNGDDSVTEIALKVGFYDHSVFSRQFSKIVGISPSLYRKSRSSADRRL
ncbi:MAG: AraC-like DNA-binding protein [Verrucomicrobiales bacterium]|jgi:AraC-like DNA-binding protein